MDSSALLSLIGTAALLFLSLLFASFETIPAGHVGVILRFGKVQEDFLLPGLGTKTPFADTVVEIDTRIKAVAYSSIAFSKDTQQITTEASLQYSLNPNFVSQMYSKIGKRELVEASIIQKAIAESLKAVTANYSAETLISKRAELKTEIEIFVEKYIEKSLTEAKLTGLIQISNIALTDFSFSEGFNRSIEEKVKAKEMAAKAKEDKIRQITQAEAAKAEKQLNAEADAFAINALAKAKAEAIRVEAEALKDNPELIKLRMLEKWDGVLPKFMNGDEGNIMAMLDFDLDEEEE